MAIKTKKQQRYQDRRNSSLLERQSATRAQKKLTLSLYHSIIKNAPSTIIAQYEPLSFREKLFIAYVFESSTMTEAAIKCGYVPSSASIIAMKLKKKLEDILQYIEENIVCSVTSTILDNNIICREAIVEKMVKMLTPDIGDFEDYEEAKKNGLLSAVKERTIVEFLDKNTGEVTHTKNTLKMVDQLSVAKALNEMLGYNMPRKKEVDMNNRNVSPPSNITINYIGVSPKNKTEKIVGPIKIEAKNNSDE